MAQPNYAEPGALARLALAITLGDAAPDAFLHALSALPEVRKAVFFELDRDGGAHTEHFAANMPDRAWDQYHARYHAFDPWAGPVLASGERFNTASRLVSLDSVKRGEFYNDFLRAKRLFDDAASVTTPTGCGKVGALALYTEFGHGAFEDASLRVIAAAAPDIEMFMRLRDRAMRTADREALHAARQEAGAGPGPAALVDGALRVLVADPEFESPAGPETAAPWRVIHGRAELRDRRAQARLEAFAAAGARLGAPGAAPLDLPLLETATLRMEARRVVVSDPLWKAERGATLIFVSPSAAAVAARRRQGLIARGLTGAEADVVLLLTAGASPAEAASARGAARATVRVQIREAMGKLRCHRQSQLVAAALAL
ncbi:MAG: hypothetical protein CML46_01460 [Rhodobacteraceae bacterium]|nr:hypothetical protein [Paracoccaceae bacterium]